MPPHSSYTRALAIHRRRQYAIAEVGRVEIVATVIYAQLLAIVGTGQASLTAIAMPEEYVIAECVSFPAHIMGPATPIGGITETAAAVVFAKTERKVLVLHI